MICKWPFYLIILFASYSTAQKNLDSLYTVWQDKSKTDSIRVSAYEKYIRDKVLFRKPDSAFILAKELIVFANAYDYPKAEADAYKLQGVSFHLLADYATALEYYNKGLKIYKEIEALHGIASSQMNIGSINLAQGNYTEALKQYQHSLAIEEKLDNKIGISNTLNNLGAIYLLQGDYPKSLNYYKRSLKIRVNISDNRGIAESLVNIGNVYSEQNNFQLAMEYFRRSMVIQKEIKDSFTIAKTIGNMGIIFEKQKNYSQALEYQKRGLDIYKKLGDKRGIAISLLNIGSLYYHQQNYTQALSNHQQSLKLQQEIGDKRGVAASLLNIGLSYKKQNLFYKSITLCNEALVLSKEIGGIKLQKEISLCLYEAYKALGNGAKALAYHEQILILNDSLQSEETAKKLQQMEFAKQVLADSLAQVEKNLKVELAHQTEVREKDKNKNIAIGAGIFFLLAAGGFYSRWRYVKKSKSVIEKEKDRSENLLLNILPSEIAEELKIKGSADAKDFDLVSILFTDFKEFTQVSEKLTAKELIDEINVCFKAFDLICEKHGIEKIKTIGDAYMAAGGLPVPSENSVKNTVLAGLEMQTFISNRIEEKDRLNELSFKMRLGIHTGPVVAGIVGVKKFQYDLWGDTVNTASRMESSGQIGCVNISEDTYALLKNEPDLTFISRGKIKAKGKGEIAMYFVSKKKQDRTYIKLKT